jgi:hypothetical protein
MHAAKHCPRPSQVVLWFASCLIFLSAALPSAIAQEGSDESSVFNQLEAAQDKPFVFNDWVKAAFFHVTVTGKLQGKTPPEEATRQGKAFAIAPNLLVTAQHIVGDPAEWRHKTSQDDRIEQAIERAAHPLDRNVQIKRATDTGSDSAFANPMVLPVSPYPVDTAAISFQGLSLERFFRLSMCGIQDKQHYAALMTDDDNPTDPRSVDRITAVELVAKGYDPKKYDTLYTFEPVDSSSIKGDGDGHDGSPIFDSDGNVVAIVSGVVASGDKWLLLATPIQPIFPGASALMALGPDISGNADTNMKCSLFDTVKRIRNEVASHAVWTVEVEPAKSDNDYATIRISYENLEENPNIDSIEVTYNFFGLDQDDQTSVETIREYNDPNKNKLPLPPSGKREFKTTEIAEIGNTLVVPHVKAARPVGFIQYVQLKIVPKLSNKSGGGLLDRSPVTRYVPWSLLEKKSKTE